MHASKTDIIIFISILLLSCAFIIFIIYEFIKHPRIFNFILICIFVKLFIKEFVDILYTGNIIQAISVVKFMYMIALCFILYYTFLK